VRETLFNWLQPVVAGSRCLDLCAGTGALGLEAASRGAREVILVERNRQVAAALRQTVLRLGAQGVEIVCQEALAFLSGPAQPFDIVFLDPPFRDSLWSQCCRCLDENGWLLPGASVYLEYPRGLHPSLPEAWAVVRCGRAGWVQYSLARLETAGPST
jgi:16S rRNA (guanine966-N2)-methyltransferase